MQTTAPEPERRVNRSQTIRVRVTPAGMAEAKRLTALHGHPTPSDYVRALLAADSRRNPPKD